MARERSVGASSRRGPGIHRLLLGVNILTLLLPVSAVAVLQLYNEHLVHLTERALISESVVIGEAWRDRWLEARGIAPEKAPSTGPPGVQNELFPIEPSINLRRGLQPPVPPATRSVQPGPGPEWIA